MGGYLLRVALVLDASVVVDFLLHREPAYSLIKSQILSAQLLAAPHLLDAEVTQKRCNEIESTAAVEQCVGFINRVNHEPTFRTSCDFFDN